jgi:hypothetical protein
MPGIDEGCYDSEDIWRRGKEKRGDSFVAQGLDDSREEVGDRGRGDDAKEHNHLDDVD